MRAEALNSLGLGLTTGLAGLTFHRRPVGSRQALVLGLEGSSLSLACGRLLELCVSAQVLERLADVEVDAHRLDVLRRELLLRLGTIRGYR